MHPELTLYLMCPFEAHATCLTREAAEQKGAGRWNSAEVPMLYLAESPALALLEAYVHLDRAGGEAPLCVLPVQVPQAAVQDLEPADLPHDWRSRPHPASTQRLGDAWWHARRSLLLRVPSAVMPLGHNVLLNLEHPDFARLAVGVAQPYRLDPALLERLD